jgi:hypothetical protein
MKNSDFIRVLRVNPKRRKPRKRRKTKKSLVRPHLRKKPQRRRARTRRVGRVKHKRAWIVELTITDGTQTQFHYLSHFRDGEPPAVGTTPSRNHALLFHKERDAQNAMRAIMRQIKRDRKEGTTRDDLQVIARVVPA